MCWAISLFDCKDKQNDPTYQRDHSPKPQVWSRLRPSSQQPPRPVLQGGENQTPSPLRPLTLPEASCPDITQHLKLCITLESSRNSSSSRSSPAGTRGSPDRKSFGDFRRNNSLTSGLLLLATGRRSLGQMFSDNSGNSNSAKTVEESSLEVVESVGNRNDMILSYSHYLAQTQAAAALRQS